MKAGATVQVIAHDVGEVEKRGFPHKVLYTDHGLKHSGRWDQPHRPEQLMNCVIALWQRSNFRIKFRPLTFNTVYGVGQNCHKIQPSPKRKSLHSGLFILSVWNKQAIRFNRYLQGLDYNRGMITGLE